MQNQKTRRAPAHPPRLLVDPRQPWSLALFPRPSRRLVRSGRPSCRCAAAERNSSAPLAPPAPPSRLHRAAQTAERVSTLRDCRTWTTSSTESGLVLSFQSFESSAIGSSRAHSKPDDWRSFKKHSGKAGEARRAETRKIADASGNDLNLHVLRRGMLRQERGHSLRPALQSFRAAERNNDCQHVLCRARHHGPLRIARRAPVWPNGVREQRQSFQIQIILADAFVRFARAPRPKNNFPRDVTELKKSNRH